MKREYHLSKRMALTMAYDIAKQYGDNLLDISDFEIWNIKLENMHSGEGIYIEYKYSVLIEYYDIYINKYKKETIQINISEKTEDGNFITKLIKIQDTLSKKEPKKELK